MTVVRIAAALLLTLLVAPTALFFGGASLNFYLEDTCRRDASGYVPQPGTLQFPNKVACQLQDGSLVSVTNWFPILWLATFAIMVLGLVAATWWFLVLRSKTRTAGRYPTSHNSGYTRRSATRRRQTVRWPL